MGRGGRARAFRRAEEKRARGGTTRVRSARSEGPGGRPVGGGAREGPRRTDASRASARARRASRGDPPRPSLASRAEPSPNPARVRTPTRPSVDGRRGPPRPPPPVASIRRLGTPRETGDGRAVASGASVPRRGRPARSRVRGRGPRTDRLANERTNAQTNRADWMMCGRFGRRGERRSAERSASTSLYSRARGTNRTDWRERENVVEACILLRAPRLVQGIRAHSERARSSPPDRGEAIEYRP
jgi:hypothetical protein